METKVYDLGYFQKCKYVVIFALYKGGLLLCQKRGRDTWETPGGHIEPGETTLQAARRELWEETGAERYQIVPAFDYWAKDDVSGAAGRVFFARIESLGELPAQFEMERVEAFTSLPSALSFPGILPVLLGEIETRFGRVLNSPENKIYRKTHNRRNPKMLRIAMISKWHVHAKGYAKFVQSQEDAEIACVWDEQPERGREWAKELGVEYVEKYEDVLARADVDAVFIDSPTNLHKELMIKAARAGKHIFTEKVMAFKTADCDEIIAEIDKAGVKFGISFPHRCMPRNLFVKQAVESGAIGDVTVLRVRNCHDGALRNWLPDYWYDPETTGGGAMMDLGAHPMYLSSWILGKPTRINSMFNNYTPRPVEDNSVCTIEFENKAIAISETSLVSPLTPVMMEIYGTKGVILCVDDDVRIRTKESVEKVEGGWIKPKLPEALPHPVRQWIDGVLYGAEIRFGTAEARALSQLMEGAYLSDAEKRTIEF